MTFDVREFARTARGSHRGELDLESLTHADVDVDTARLIRTMRDLERHTMERMRNLLVTATHKDARVTAFLTTWAFEKFWIADALQRVVEAHEGVSLPQPKKQSRVVAFVDEIRERARPISGSIRANRLGEDMIAVHMTLGAIDEWMTQAALTRIVELEPDPALRAIVEPLVAVQARQLEFFEAQARDRLAVSARTRTVVAKQIAGARWPIGAAAEPKSETRFFYSYLFASAPAIGTAIDTQISTLPGLEGLNLMSRAIASHGSAV